MKRTKKTKDELEMERDIIIFDCYQNLEVAFLSAVDHIECIIRLGDGNIKQKIRNAFEVYQMAHNQIMSYANLGLDVKYGGYDPSMYDKKLEDVYERLSPVAKYELTKRDIIYETICN